MFAYAVEESSFCTKLEAAEDRNLLAINSGNAASTRIEYISLLGEANVFTKLHRAQSFLKSIGSPSSSNTLLLLLLLLLGLLLLLTIFRQEQLKFFSSDCATPFIFRTLQFLYYFEVNIESISQKLVIKS